MAEAPVNVKPDTIVMIRWAERHAGLTVAEQETERLVLDLQSDASGNTTPFPLGSEASDASLLAGGSCGRPPTPPGVRARRSREAWVQSPVEESP